MGLRTALMIASLALAACSSDGGSDADADPGADTGVALVDTAATADTTMAEDTGEAVDTADVADSATPPDSAAADTAVADTTSPPDTVCVPQCEARTCGEDGCGGSCGSCSPGYACTDGGYCYATTKYCTAPCGTVSDCLAPEPVPGYGAANFACTGGACHYTGCHSDSDCAVVNSALGTGTCTEMSGPYDYCLADCNTPSDCAVQSGVPAFDADNYACEDGLCMYQGCNSDSECSASYQDDSYGCNDTLTYPLCGKRCASPSDCVVPNSSALYDASHYACEGGWCRYTGCTSSAECDAAGLTGYLCVVQ